MPTKMATKSDQNIFIYSSNSHAKNVGIFIMKILLQSCYGFKM